MPAFSDRSKKILATVHPSLRKVLESAIREVDFSVVSGFRTQEEQKRLYAEGKTKLLFSPHNVFPALAVDIQPYPAVEVTNKEWELLRQNPTLYQLLRWWYLAGFIKGVALERNVKLRWGGDWNQNNDPRDERFRDLYHFELYELFQKEMEGDSQKDHGVIDSSESDPEVLSS